MRKINNNYLGDFYIEELENREEKDRVKLYDSNYNYLDLSIQLETTSIPISGASPVFVPSHIRAKHIKIVDVEVYNIGDTDEEFMEDEKSMYIIIVEEVK